MRLTIVLFVLIIGGSFISCENEKTGKVVIRLTDSPGDYDKVNIDISDVEVQINGTEWYSLETNTGIYDLLELSGGAQIILAEADIPSGNITQVRLILGNQNSVVVNGQTKDLSTPSAMQSGLKLTIEESLIEGLTYTLLLDFDAARSVVVAGNSGNYNLKPVIRVIDEARDGALTGSITPAEENVAVYVLNGQDTLGTSYAKAGSAKWFVGGLDTGSYQVHFDPGTDSVYKLTVLDNISVEVGKITETGSNELIFN